VTGRRLDARYLRRPGAPDLPRPADVARLPDGIGPSLADIHTIPRSLAHDNEWRELARVDRALAKLQKAFDALLGDGAEATAYLADARTALYDASQAFVRECPPRATQAMARATARIRRPKP
jgi:hypothetical protein